MPSLRPHFLILALAALLSIPAARAAEPLALPTPAPAGPALDTRLERARTTFRQTGDSHRGADPFQDVELTAHTKQASGNRESRPSTLSAANRRLVDSLTDPRFMRSLRNTRVGEAARVPVAGSLRGAAPTREAPWSEDTLLANPTDMNDEYVSLARSPLSGKLYAVFAAKDLGGTDRDIHIAVSADEGLSWDVLEMPSFSADEYHPEIAIDGAGYIHVVWIRDDGWILRARTSAADDITDWAWVRGLGTEEVHATPSIAVSGAGDFATVFIAAGWLTINYDYYQYEWTLIFMFSTNGGQTVTYDYFNPDGYQDYWPDVAMQGGLVHFLNAEADAYSGEMEILAASDLYNGGFGDIGYFTGYTPNNTGFPQIACQNENVYVVFQEDYTDGIVSDGDIIYVYSQDAGESWFGPFGLVADEYESVGPSIFTRDGIVGALWLDAPAGADEFYLASRLGSGFGHPDLMGEVELVSDEPRVEPMFHSCFGTPGAGRMHAAWIDRRDYPTQGHNVYTSSRPVQANLAPFTPAGWDTCLVAGMEPGRRTQGYLAAGDTTWISFAFINAGLADAAGTFSLALDLDGIPVAEWALDGGLETGTWVPVEDFPLVVGPGRHSLGFRLDTAGDVAETDETDNTHVQSFTWVDGDPALRLEPAHLVHTITPETARRDALDLVQNPILQREANLQVIGTRLGAALDHSGRDDLLRVMVVPAERLDPAAMAAALRGASRTTRREVIVAAARTQIQRTMVDLGPTLSRLTAAGQGAAPQPLWLSGSIAVQLTPAAIEELAADPAVGRLWLDDQRSEAFGAPLFSRENGTATGRASAWHIGHIGADQAWSAGLTGEGIIVGHLDTGVAYDHPDLAGRMWDGGSVSAHHGWDTVDDDADPYDGDEYFHGTHTAGLIVGDGSAGTGTGVAPGATLMAIRAMPGYMEDMIEGLQFGLDHGAHLFSLSGGWGQASDEVRAANRYNAELLLSVDIPWIAAAGNGDNYGGHYAVPADIASPGGCPSPSYHPGGAATAVFSVGATLQDNSLWAFSSYGPTAWDMANPHGETDYQDFPWPPGLIKPDIAAPGGNIVSCYGDGGYVTYSGTSMATPLVTGAFCLIWSGQPSLLVPQVCTMLEEGATDLATVPCSPGRDNFSGAGLLNIPAALGQMPTAQGVPFRIHNDGDLPLLIGAVETGVPWLDILMPEGAVAPGDSVAATALLDPALLQEGVHQASVQMASNDPTGPHTLPVTLIYGDGTSAVQTHGPQTRARHLSNHPNPFNPQTLLRFELARPGPVDLCVYDLKGRLVRRLREGEMAAGSHEVLWDGRDSRGQETGSGQYLARLVRPGQAPLTRKLLLVR